MTFVKLRTFSFLVQINESTVAIKRKQTDKRRRVHTHTHVFFMMCLTFVLSFEKLARIFTIEYQHNFTYALRRTKQNNTPELT